MDTKTVKFKPKLIGDLLDMIHNAIIVINAENRIIFANSRTSEMFRASVKDLIDQPFYSLFMPDDQDILVPNILHIVREEHEFESELMLRSLDGTTFMGMVSGTYFQWDSAQAGMAFSIHDLTEMKVIEQSLRKSERIAFLGHLVDDISHQIRNPVTIIGGFARRLEGSGQSVEQVTAILNEASRLEQLLDNLNYFINLRRPEPKRLRLKDFMAEVESIVLPRVKESDCSWLCEYEEGVKDDEILIDKDLMAEALEAIIINACESYDMTIGDNEVVVRVHSSSDKLLPYVISVIDTGKGIPHEVFPQVFHHFHTNKTNHVGMGLTLAQRIVEEQRGSLSIISEPGMGTSVSFHLMKERRRPIRTMKL
ncbi:MAG: ATP-binding protein [Thermodesulfobacteriota bacterium]